MCATRIVLAMMMPQLQSKRSTSDHRSNATVTHADERMVCCGAFRCSERVRKGISEHTFPTVVEMRKIRIAKVNRKEQYPGEKARVCADVTRSNAFHFTFGKIKNKHAIFF